MAIKSMTGFARRDGSLNGATWHWEVRSVNNRSLDLRLRLPPGYETLEPAVRDATAKRITRGSVSINLRAERETGEAQVRLNETALAAAIKATERIRQITGGEPPRAEGLLALKGVLELIENPEDETATARLHEAMLKSFTEALDGMVAARDAEGRRLKTALDAQVLSCVIRLRSPAPGPGRSPRSRSARSRR